MTAQQQSLFDLPPQAVSIYGTPIPASPAVGRRALDAETEVRILGREPLPPHQRHSDTSRAAAVAIQPHLPPLEQKVYDFLKDRGCVGSSDEDGCIALGMNGSTYRPRRISLVEKGLVRDSGERTAGLSGRMAALWVAV